MVQFNRRDEAWMRRALDLAREAEQIAEVPVGAVIVLDGVAVGEGFNSPITSKDATAHAEIMALRHACNTVGNYRVPGSVMYVTLEPCAMCAGALVQARVEKLVFAARDIRFGAVRSKFRLADSELLNHSVRVEEGLLAAEAGSMLSEFFKKRRTEE